MISVRPGLSTSQLEELRTWRDAAAIGTNERLYLDQILEARARGDGVYAVAQQHAFAGAVTVNVEMVPPTLNLIWLHPKFRDRQVSAAALRDVLRDILSASDAVAVWKPNARVRKILVELGMDPAYDEPCTSIEFDRGELRLEETKLRVPAER